MTKGLKKNNTFLYIYTETNNIYVKCDILWSHLYNFYQGCNEYLDNMHIQPFNQVFCRILLYI